MEEEMELMELWIEEVRGFDDTRVVSHKDLLPAQKRMVNERWLALVDVQVKANSVAAASFLWKLVKVLSLVSMVVTPSGWTGDPLVTTEGVAPFLIAPLADPSV